jgi:hypothetical protein
MDFVMPLLVVSGGTAVNPASERCPEQGKWKAAQRLTEPAEPCTSH